jgi:DNA-binding PucR family transcriptional regulator
MLLSDITSPQTRPTAHDLLASLIRPRHEDAIAILAAYDARRRSELLRTLERHLGDRGSVAPTARALYIHPNTLRQRLGRIEHLTGLSLAHEDLLSLELALRLHRLREPR